MNLAQIQSALFSLVTADRQTKTAPAAIVGGGALQPDARVHIYAEMYVLRTQDSIREDFPKVTEKLGDRFEQTVLEYVQQHHSTHYSLGMLGEHFPAFLRARGEKELADLALLEWLHAAMFIAPDSEVVEGADLAKIDPEKFGGARLEFVPAFRLVWFEFDPVKGERSEGERSEGERSEGERPPFMVSGVEPRAAEGSERGTPDAPLDSARGERVSGGLAPGRVGSVAPDLRTGTPYLVWRKGHEVFHVAVEPDEARAIEALQAGGTIEAACEAFAGREDPAVAAFTAIGSWVTESMVARVVL
jgi:hypothetical protein